MKHVMILLLCIALLGLSGCHEELQSMLEIQNSEAVILVYPDIPEVPLVEPSLFYYNDYFGLTLELPASFSMLRAPNISTVRGAAEDIDEFDYYYDKDDWHIYELVVFKNHDDSAFDDYCECTIVAVANPENFTMSAYAERLVESVTTKVFEPRRVIEWLGTEQVDIRGIPYTQISLLDTEPGFYDFYQEIYITQMNDHFVVISLLYNYEVNGRPGQKVAQRIINDYIVFQ